MIKVIVLLILLTAPMVMAMDMLPYDRETLVSHCYDLPCEGTFNRNTCIYFLDQDITLAKESTSCPRMKCMAMTAACVATCVYQVPMCYPAASKCTQCLNSLYTMCCSCVLPDSICR